MTLLITIVLISISYLLIKLFIDNSHPNHPA